MADKRTTVVHRPGEGGQIVRAEVRQSALGLFLARGWAEGEPPTHIAGGEESAIATAQEPEGIEQLGGGEQLGAGQEAEDLEPEAVAEAVAEVEPEATPAEFPEGNDDTEGETSEVSGTTRRRRSNRS